MLTPRPRSFVPLLAFFLQTIDRSHGVSLQQRALGPPPGEFENGWTYQGCYMYEID